MLNVATPGQFVLRAPIETGTGPLPRPIDSGYRGAEYDFISAVVKLQAKDEEYIEYAIDTTRARTEVRAQSAQIGSLRKLVAAASCNNSVDERIGRTLFQLLIPPEMESFLAGSVDLQLELDKGTAAIPWADFLLEASQLIHCGWRRWRFAFGLDARRFRSKSRRSKG